MFDIHEQLIIYKFDLIHKCINAKGKGANYWKELKKKLILVDSLIKKVKANNSIECTKEIAEIKDFITKTR